MTRILLLLITVSIATSCQPAGKNAANDQAAPAALTAAEQDAYLAKGQEIVQATFAELSGELAAALETGGVGGAIRYCNLTAYPLVDSLSRVHQAVIRRTSLKVRNPADQPTPFEREVLDAYHRQEGELQPKVMEISGQQVAFFAPIRIQPLCLNCHGQVGAEPGISTGDYAIIRELYPQDEAIGYQQGDLRGMWSITFKR